jgi:hypothetical protein
MDEARSGSHLEPPPVDADTLERLRSLGYIK